MAQNFFDDRVERRAAHMRLARERARGTSDVRAASVVGAHGALFTSLRRGLIQTEDRLDEESLIAMFSVSRNSVRGALKLLAEEGLVSRSPKRGTQVVARSLDVPLSTPTGWGPTPGRARHEGEYELVVTDDRWVAATPVSQRHLRTTHDQVHQIEVTDIRYGHPVMLYTCYTLGEGARRPLVTGPNDTGFAELFERAYGSPLGRVECWVEATHASERSAARLDVAPGTPLIVRSRILEDTEGVPREYSISHYLAARVNMSAHAGGELGSAAHDIEPLAPAARAEGRVPRPPSSSEGRRASAADLHTELRAAIRDGILEVGDELDEEELARAFGAERTVVRQALDHLAQEEIISRTPGGAAVVAAAICSFTLASGQPYRATEQLRFHNKALTSGPVPVPRFLRGVFDGDADRVHRDEHVVHRDGQPILVLVRYTDGQVPSPRPLTSHRNADFASLFTASYGVSPGTIDSWVHAIRADEQIARRLGVATGAVVLILERLTHDALGRVRELSHSYIRAGAVSLHVSHEVHHEPRSA